MKGNKMQILTSSYAPLLELLLNFAPSFVPHLYYSFLLPLLCISAYTSLPLTPLDPYFTPFSSMSLPWFFPSMLSGVFFPCRGTKDFSFSPGVPLVTPSRCWAPETPVVMNWPGSLLLGTQLQILPVESLPHRETFAIAEEEIGLNIVDLSSRIGCFGKFMNLEKTSHNKPTDPISYPVCD